MTLLNWRDAGEGPAVVLLHAFPCSNRMWDHQIEALSAVQRRVLAPDLPGFGDSPLPTTAPSLETVVQQVHQDLAHLGVDRCAVAGLSLGGYVAMEWMRKYPESVGAWMLCDTKATIDSDAGREGRKAMVSEVMSEPESVDQVLETRMMTGLLGVTSRAQRPSVVDQVRSWLRQVSASSIVWYQEAMLKRPDSRPVLRRLKAPVLVLWGSEDTLSPEDEQREMLTCLQNPHWEIVSDAGHLSAVENPQRVSQAMADFLTTAIPIDANPRRLSIATSRDEDSATRQGR